MYRSEYTSCLVFVDVFVCNVYRCVYIVFVYAATLAVEPGGSAGSRY